jgi:hypothetical protein
VAFYTGRTGSLKVVGTADSEPTKKVAKIRDWSLETTVELLSTTAIDSIANTYTPGIKGATGSATLIYYRVTGPEVSEYYEFTKLLNKIMREGAITENQKVRLELNVGGNADDDIRFDAYITSAQVGASTGELSIVPIQFTMDGDFLDVIQ